MGYMRHHSIVVTASDDDIKPVHDKAKEMFGHLCSEIIPSNLNGYNSFFIAPNGSKYGWPESDDSDKKRNLFIDFIEKNNDDNDGDYIRYVEVFYGEDYNKSKILKHNNRKSKVLRHN